MATRTVTITTDDVTGEDCQDATTVVMVVDSIIYEVDMSDKTRTEYAKAIERYRIAGRRVGRLLGNGSQLRLSSAVPSAASVPTQRATPDKEQSQAIREWWNANAERAGLPPVTKFGRIPAAVQEAFHEYQGVAVPEVAAQVAAVKERAGQPVPAATFSAPEEPQPKPPAAKKVAPAPPAKKVAAATRKAAPATSPAKGAATAKVSATPARRRGQRTA